MERAAEIIARGFSARPSTADDLDAIYEICVATGDGGEDARHMYRNPCLIGHIYAGPYATLEPDACFILEDAGGICGYLVGTADSTGFSSRCERDWYPSLRRHHPAPAPEDMSPDARMLRAIHRGYRPDPDVAAFPAHLHIDLLPRARGLGLGTALLRLFLDHVRSKGATGVHLQTGRSSLLAQRFYERNGFVALKSDERTVTYVMPLAPR